MKTAAASTSTFVLTDQSQWPPVLTIDEIAIVYRLSVPTIRKYIQNGTFAPRPWDRYPYRWRREDVIADLKRKRIEQPIRNHGFRMAKAKGTRS